METNQEENNPKVILFHGYTGNGRSLISQAELRRFLELKASFVLARRDYCAVKDSLLHAMRAGCLLEPGFLSAQVVSRQRTGYTVDPSSYEELIVGC